MEAARLIQVAPLRSVIPLRPANARIFAIPAGCTRLPLCRLISGPPGAVCGFDRWKLPPSVALVRVTRWRRCQGHSPHVLCSLSAGARHDIMTRLGCTLSPVSGAGRRGRGLNGLTRQGYRWCVPGKTPDACLYVCMSVRALFVGSGQYR